MPQNRYNNRCSHKNMLTEGYSEIIQECDVLTSKITMML